MEFTFKAEVKATREAIWPYYVDPTKRSIWEDDLESLVFNGDIKTGTTGKVKLKNMPEMQFELINIVEQEAYWDRTDVPGIGSLYFGHEILGEDGKIFIRHTVQMKDDEEPDLAFLSGVFADVPESIMKIKNAVEA